MERAAQFVFCERLSVYVCAFFCFFFLSVLGWDVGFDCCNSCVCCVSFYFAFYIAFTVVYGKSIGGTALRTTSGLLIRSAAVHYFNLADTYYRIRCSEITEGWVQ